VSGVRQITLRYLFAVNCYLLTTAAGHVLIDAGFAPRRAALELALEMAGCAPGTLRLIALTHAHADHVGNAVSLRARYGAPLALHPGDAAKARRGDMFWSVGRRGAGVVVARAATRLAGIGSFQPFAADVLLEDGQDLGEFGLAATAVHLPGHSPGSVGVLTEAGELFCGDLLTNTRGGPRRNTVVDDAEAMEASMVRLRELPVRTVYPGHGQAFPIESLAESSKS
jgi:hydroxyacylglutathione hydrolase